MKRFHSPTAGLLALGALVAATATFVATSAVSKEAEAKAKKVTYSGQVARILQDNCQTCHHPGTAAPFSLMTREDAVKWADSIKEAVSDKRMPPWYADPHFGKFANDRRLKPADLEALLTWIDNGMEAGDPKDMPPERTYEDGWVIGKPDVVFDLPVEYSVP